MEIKSHMIYGQKNKTQDRSNIVKNSIMPLKSRHKKSLKNKNIKEILLEAYISTINLNVSGLNAPTKRHRVIEWMQK